MHLTCFITWSSQHGKKHIYRYICKDWIQPNNLLHQDFYILGQPQGLITFEQPASRIFFVQITFGVYYIQVTCVLRQDSFYTKKTHKTYYIQVTCVPRQGSYLHSNNLSQDWLCPRITCKLLQDILPPRTTYKIDYVWVSYFTRTFPAQTNCPISHVRYYVLFRNKHPYNRGSGVTSVLLKLADNQL